MARIRTIKPEFWTDSLMVQLPHLTRLLYIALWNVADDHGFIRDEPERIAMEVMPREKPIDVDAALQLLFAAGRLEWFVDDDGFSYYRVAHWEDHQRVDHPAKSKVSREGSRKVAIPNAVRRGVAEKYGCTPGESKDATCYYCGHQGQVYWFRLADGRPSNWVVFPELELDHLECEHAGGETTTGNIVLACRTCNRGKGTKHWFDFISSQSLAIPRENSRKIALDQGSGIKDQGMEGKGEEERAALPTPTPEPKSSRRGKAQSQLVPLPEDFQLTEKMREQALKRHPDCDADAWFESFCAHHMAHGKAMKSWEHAWVTWIGNGAKFGYPRRKEASRASTNGLPVLNG